MTELNISQLEKSSDEKTLYFNFYKNNQKLISTQTENVPVGAMTLKKAGSMRFRWNETNTVRNDYMSVIEKESGKAFVPVELIHSHIVYTISHSADTHFLQGDGLITKNKLLIPTVTVADCMPIYLFDSVSKVFGIVHSGWKGTGIAVDAMKKAGIYYGSKIEDFCVILGPHIESCCYIVNEERAQFFAENFTTECVTPLEEGGSCYAGGRGLAVTWNNGNGKLYRLSLEKANLAALLKAGVKEENITVIKECTCCNEVFGSNRRETAEYDSMTAAAENGGKVIDKTQCFTVQAAYIKYL